MTEPVDAELIEDIVGHPRLRLVHVGRAVSSEKKFYILHSHECLDTYDDLTTCPYSKALDKGVTFDREDVPQVLDFGDGGLIGYDFPVPF